MYGDINFLILHAAYIEVIYRQVSNIQYNESDFGSLNVGYIKGQSMLIIVNLVICCLV